MTSSVSTADDLVNDYLIGAAHAELADSIQRGRTVLKAMNIYDQEYDLELLVRTGDTQTTDDLISMIHVTLDHYVNIALGFFEVELHPNAPLETGIAILEVINQLQQRPDPIEITTLLNAENAPEETLCEIVEQLTAIPSDTILSQVKKVSLELIQNVWKLYADAQTYMPSRSLDVYKRRYWFTQLRWEPSIARLALEQGTPLAVSLTYIRTQYAEAFSALQREASILALELLGLLTLTSLPLEDYPTALAELLDEWVVDLTLIVRTKNQFMPLLTTLTQYEQDSTQWTN